MVNLTLTFFLNMIGYYPLRFRMRGSGWMNDYVIDIVIGQRVVT